MINNILKNKTNRSVAEDNMVVKGLFDAIAAMQFKLVENLIEGEVDINISIASVTPLMTACMISQQSSKEKYQLIQLLLKYGSDLNARDHIDHIAFHYAHMCCCSWTIGFLEKHRCTKRKRFKSI